MFRPIWLSSGASKIVVENPYATVNEYDSKICFRLRVHVLYVCNISAFHVWSALVFPTTWLDVYLLVVQGDSSYVSCAAVYVVGPFTSLHVRR
jgi:hypothetical protein